MRRKVAVAAGALLAIAAAIGAIAARRSSDGLQTSDGIQGGAGGGAAPAAIDGDASDAAGSAARGGLASHPRPRTAPPTEHEDRLTGRVVDRAGAPVADARVLDIPSGIPTLFELDEVGREGLDVADAVTGADGHFTVAARGETALHTLVARTAAGAIGCLAGVALGRDATIVVDGGGSIAGTVTDREGRPIDRATVVVDGALGALHVRREATTAADGTYRLDGIPTPSLGSPVEEPAYRSLVEVRADGFAPLLQPGSPTPSLSGEVIERRFVLSLGSIVEGTIVDQETKAPVAGARVVLWSQEGLRRDFAELIVVLSLGSFFGAEAAGAGREIELPSACRILAETRSDAAGAFRFEHVPGRGFHEPIDPHRSEFGVTAIGPGLAPATGWVSRLLDGARQRVALEAGASTCVEGRVVTPPSVPTSSVVLASSPSPWELPPGLFPGLSDRRVEHDGCYRLDGIPVRRQDGQRVIMSASVVLVSNPWVRGLPPTLSVQVEVPVRAGEVTAAPDLVLDDATAPPTSPYRASLRIVDEVGTPVWGARVASEQVYVSATASTDRGGTAQLPCPATDPGVCRVLVTRDGFAAACVEIEFDGVAPPAPVTVVLRRGHSISGAVRRADGAPAVGAHLSVARASVGAAPVSDAGAAPMVAESKAWRIEPPHALPAFAVAVTDRSGRFAIEDLPAGSFTVRAALAIAGASGDDEEVGVANGVAADATGLSLLLAPSTAPAPGRIVGTVRVGETGLAPRDFHVELRLASGAALVSETADGRSSLGREGVLDAVALPGPGRFAFDGVPPGTHRLRLSSEGFTVRDLDVVVASGATVVVPSVDLDRGIVLHGRARAGADVDFAKGRYVAVVPTTPRGVRRDDDLERTAPVGADGTFDVGGLAPGSWRVYLPTMPYGQAAASPVERSAIEIPDGVREVSWEGTFEASGWLSVDVWDERLPTRTSGRLEPTAEQRAFAEGSEVAVLDERGRVVVEQKGGLVRGDRSVASALALAPGTYTVRTKAAGEAPKEERVTVVAGQTATVNFGQPSPGPPASGGGCGKGKCG